MAMQNGETQKSIFQVAATLKIHPVIGVGFQIHLGPGKVKIGTAS
jgi:hypothetical protein